MVGEGAMNNSELAGVGVDATDTLANGIGATILENISFLMV